MDISLILYGLAGLVALVIGAEILVRGASSLAQRFGVSPLVVGLTVVAFGTSAPELAVSLSGALGGQGDIAVGNALGSNLFNILVILGISALATPLVVAQQLVRKEVPLMIGVTAVVLLMALDGEFARWEGFVLFAGFIGYTLYTLVQSKKSTAAVEAEYDEEFGRAPRRGALGVGLEVGGVLAGLVLLVLGSRWFVSSAIDLARIFEVSEVVISLTIVAAGTSMPELATSVMASLRGERDIAVGNVVGSNIFNLLVVLGLTTSISPGLTVDPGVLAFDLPLVLAVSIACLPIFFSGHVIDRWEGAIFLLYYVAYATYLALAATEHSALEPFSVAMFAFVIPVTVLTLGIIFYRSRQRA
ncbi:MAG: calcium/sodium antiporter [Persicimonas sp.]